MKEQIKETGQIDETEMMKSFTKFMADSKNAGHMMVCVAAEPGAPAVAWTSKEGKLNDKEELLGAFALACRALAGTFVAQDDIPSLLEACAEWSRDLLAEERAGGPEVSYADARLDAMFDEKVPGPVQ